MKKLTNTTSTLPIFIITSNNKNIIMVYFSQDVIFNFRAKYQAKKKLIMGKQINYKREIVTTPPPLL